MGELKNKAKTSYEIFILWNEQVDKRKWIPLEVAQKDHDEQENQIIKLALDLTELQGRVEQFRKWLDLMHSTSVTVSFDDAKEKFAEVFGEKKK